MGVNGWVCDQGKPIFNISSCFLQGVVRWDLGLVEVACLHGALYDVAMSGQRLTKTYSAVAPLARS